MFRSATVQCRWIVPFTSSGSIQRGKQPYATARQDGQPMALPPSGEGFRWPDARMTRRLTITITTTTLNTEMAGPHNRMPVMPEQVT